MSSTKFEPAFSYMQSSNIELGSDTMPQMTIEEIEQRAEHFARNMLDNLNQINDEFPTAKFKDSRRVPLIDDENEFPNKTELSKRFEAEFRDYLASHYSIRVGHSSKK
jgi:hypothetical protein